MANETTKVRLWQIEYRATAIKFSTAPPGGNGRTLWLPRSQIEHISRDMALQNGWIPATVTLQIWLATKENL